MTNKQPWAGLASYEDPQKSELKLKFCGRDNDIYDVTRLIDDNLLLILYGKSGIGKTSLFNAGVFPKLRLEQYLPVSIRLGTLEADASYQEAIIAAVEKAIKEIHGSITVYNVVEEQTDNQQPDRLWNYFAKHRFVNAEQQSLFPVVVLDQFEEVLRNTNSEHVGKAQTLLNQLQYLIDESHALSDCIVEGKEYFYDFNFRFVISIREDELYLLEDNIDDLSLSMFRNCRYRLRSLSEQGAKEAILVPGRDCISEEEKQAVVARVIELSKRQQSNDIDTFLLSLVCAGTFDKKAGSKITLSDLAVWKSNPMEVYYQDAIKGLSANQVRYIQQHLIREDGSRKRVDAQEVKTAIGESTYNTLTQGENRMLVLGEHNQVELLHDQLALAVYEERKDEEEKERKRKQRQKRIRSTGIVILFIILGVFIVQFRRYKQMRWKMLENQSRFIAAKVQDLQLEYYDLGSLLTIEVLPHNLKHPNRPYTPEAEFALRKTLKHKGISIRLRNADLRCISFSNDGKNLAAAVNNTILVYDTLGILIDSIYHNSSITSLSYSPNNKYLAFSTFEKIIMVDLYTKNNDSIYINGASWIRSIIFNSNSNIILFGTDTGKIGVVNTDTHNINYLSDPYDISSIMQLALSPNNELLVSVDANNSVKLWNISTKKVLKLLNSFKSTVRTIRFSSNGHIIVSSDEKNVIVYDTTGNELYSLTHDYAVTSAIMTNDNKHIITGSYKSINVFDATTQKKIHNIKREGTKWIFNMTANPKNNNLFAYSNGNDCLIIENLLNTSDTSYYIDLFTEKNIKSAIYSPDGKSILTTTVTPKRIMVNKYSPWSEEFKASSLPELGNCISSVSLWDSKTGIKTMSIFEDSVCVTPASFSPNGQYVVFAHDTIIKIHDIYLDKTYSFYSPSIVNSIVYSPSGQQIAFSSLDNIIRIINAKTGNIVYTNKVDYTIDYVSFSHRGAYLAAAGDQRCRIVTTPHNCRTNQLSKYLFWQPHPTGRVSFFSDGKKYLLTGHNNWLSIIENDMTKSPQKHIISQQFPSSVDKKSYETISSVSVHPEGRLYAVSFTSGLIRLCNPKNGDVLYELQHNGPVISVCFNPTGDKILAVSINGTVRIWDFPPLQNLIDQTRERFKNRPLTDEERRMYYLE